MTDDRFQRHVVQSVRLAVVAHSLGTHFAAGAQAAQREDIDGMNSATAGAFEAFAEIAIAFGIPGAREALALFKASRRASSN